MFRCSFSNLKKFHTNLLKTSNVEVKHVRMSPSTPTTSTSAAEMAQENLNTRSSRMAK